MLLIIKDLLLVRAMLTTINFSLRGEVLIALPLHLQQSKESLDP